MFNSLGDYLKFLEKKGLLARVKAPVSAKLEITEIADRVVKGPKEQNKALLFENVRGYDMPVAINLFGTEERMAWALGVERLDELNERLSVLLAPDMPRSLSDKLKKGMELLSVARSVGPKTVSSGTVQEVVITRDVSLDDIPFLTCWPEDGGPYITLPSVITRDPITGRRNVGMYRLQVHHPGGDGREPLLGMHWQIHKGGASHERAALAHGIEKIPVAVSIGGDPAIIWSGSAPLPQDIDELMLAGWLRGKPVDVVPCVTQPLEVPADAEIAIEGYVKPGETMPEGPFGDHTGFYTPREPYPVMHVTAVTHRKNPIYPTTIVGKPPMEDYWMGKATERLFLPLMRMFLPEIVDVNMPAEGVFHNLILVSIKKEFPGQGRRVINGLWGLGLMMLTKAIVVVDAEVDVQDLSQAAFAVLGNVDWARDVIIQEGPVDALDHASYQPNFGGKIGVDATRKFPGEGYGRGWPKSIEMCPEIKELVDRRWREYWR